MQSFLRHFRALTPITPAALSQRQKVRSSDYRFSIFRLILQGLPLVMVFTLPPQVRAYEFGELGRRGTRWERVSGFAGS